jgi:hypothetical protein
MTRKTIRGLFLAGLPLGVACCFRTESLLFGAALILAGVYLRFRRHGEPEEAGPLTSGRLKGFIGYMAGAAFAYLPQVWVNFRTSGSVLGGHFLGHSNLLGYFFTPKSVPGSRAVHVESFWKVTWDYLIYPRLHYLERVFLEPLWIPVLICLAIALVGRFVKKKSSPRIGEGWATALMILFLITVVMVPLVQQDITQIVPLTCNFWFTFPLAGVLISLVLVSRERDRTFRFLLWTTIFLVVLRVIAIPVVGGGQWGFRMMLPLVLPVVLLSVLEMKRAQTPWYRGALLLLLLAGLVVQGHGASHIVKNRKSLARVPERIEGLTEPGEVILTHYPILYQLCPTLTRDRTFLVIRGKRDISPILNALPPGTPVSVASHSPKRVWPEIKDKAFRYDPEVFELGWGGLRIRGIEGPLEK